MRIIFVSSEVVPFSKTGGLADVAGALPKFLEKAGHEVAVFTPLYKQVWDKFHPVKTSHEISVPVGSDLVTGTIYKDTLPDSNVPVYLIGHDSYFYRDGLYGDAKGDYSDNCSRFVFSAAASSRPYGYWGSSPTLSIPTTGRQGSFRFIPKWRMTTSPR